MVTEPTLVVLYTVASTTLPRLKLHTLPGESHDIGLLSSMLYSQSISMIRETIRDHVMSLLLSSCPHPLLAKQKAKLAIT